MSSLPDSVKRVPATQIQEVAKALSGDLRLRILEVLGDRTMSMTQLMVELGVAQPTISINIQILEQADLVVINVGSNREKLCSRSHHALLLELPNMLGDALPDMEEIQMPVGMYTDCSIDLPCGLAGKDGIIGCPDDPRTFYLPERSEAQLLWFSGAGYVEYRFPNPVPPGIELSELRLSAELCSEALGFNNEWPSDITLNINGIRIGTMTTPGDYGSHRGRLTPNWWVYGTQYGDLYEWSFDAEGCRLNGELHGRTALADLKLDFHKPITVRFEVEQDAANRNGLNIFGSSFGNLAQDIKLTFTKLHKAD
mgnify:CR=1 FL=1